MEMLLGGPKSMSILVNYQNWVDLESREEKSYEDLGQLSREINGG